MPSDSSNAHDARRDQTDASTASEGDGVSGDLQSGKTPQARILSDVPPPPGDPEDDARALLGELTVGSVVDGKYRVDAVVGRGAMGVVVVATHLGLGERVALKFLRYRGKPGGTDDFQSRFKREARVSAKLKNEHITRVIDVGVWRERVPYMVMDYLTGTDLREAIKGGGPLPVASSLDYIVQICTGIAEAHANGIVHRDLKPSNLFVTKRPDGSDLIKILDFGISKWTAGEAELEDLTQTGVVLGSPKYMSPEQLFGSADVDARADVWSIGAILYEMLCGRPPFDMPTFTKICAELSTNRMPPSLHERRPEVTPELDAVVMKCFAREPEQRIQNVAELAGAVLDAIGAPFADAVRLKIASTLDPRSGRDTLGTSSSGNVTMTSGSYSSVLSQTGGSSVRVPASMPVDTLISSSGRHKPGGAPGTRSSEGAARPGWRQAPWLIAGLLVVGGAAYVAFGSHGESSATNAASAPLTVSATPPPVPTQTQTPGESTTAAPPPPTASAAASTVASANIPGPHVVNRGSRPGPTHAPTATTVPPPATNTALPPPTTTTTTTAPVATAPPAPTQKVDPLGDRQ